jgi:hypothetical protein
MGGAFGFGAVSATLSRLIVTWKEPGSTSWKLAAFPPTIQRSGALRTGCGSLVLIMIKGRSPSGTGLFSVPGVTL